FCANITPTLHRDTLSLHDALPIYPGAVARRRCGGLYVVEGDFVNEGKQYRPGTSLHVKTGKLHGAHGTEKGCKILVLRVNSRNPVTRKERAELPHLLDHESCSDQRLQGEIVVLDSRPHDPAVTWRCS